MPPIPRSSLSPKMVQVLDTMLPPKNGKSAVIDSGFGWRPRPKGGSANHGGIDFGYPGPDLYNTHRIYSPVSGTARVKNDAWKTITIVTESGHLHQFLHSTVRLIRDGDTVSVGQPIALMGGHGPRGPREFASHVHYQIRLQEGGRRIDPIAYWSDSRQVFVNVPRERGEPVPGTPEADTVTIYDIAASEVPYHNQKEEGSEPTIAAYRPRMAAVALESGVTGALLPNRIPQHEPWDRSMLVNTRHINEPTDEIHFNTRLNPQFDAESEEGAKQLGRVFGEETTERGPFWRR